MSEFMCREMVLFAKAFWYGAFLTLIYDCLRILRSTIPHKDRMIAVEDLLFWIGSSIFLFSHFFQDNFGVLRGYLFLGAVLGSIAWKFSLGNLFVIIMRKAVKNFLNQIKRLKLWKRRCNIFLYQKKEEKRCRKLEKKEASCQKKSVDHKMGKKSMKQKKRKKSKRIRHRLLRIFRGPNTVGVFVITTIVCVLAISLYIQKNELKETSRIKEGQVEQLEKELEKEKERTETIKQMEKNIQSDEATEKIAREKIGLVKENEILFKEDE